MSALGYIGAAWLGAALVGSLLLWAILRDGAERGRQ